MSEASPSSAAGSANAGRIVMLLVALSLIAIGVLFILLMGRSYLRAKEMRDWPVVPGVVLQSSIEQRQHDPYSPPEFSHQLTYGYEWQGEAHTGERISLRGVKWSSKRQAVVASFERYPVGSAVECHVNPSEPEIAVLELDSLAPLYSIWFPALFAVGGIGMMVTVLRRPKPAK